MPSGFGRSLQCELVGRGPIECGISFDRSYNLSDRSRYQGEGHIKSYKLKRTSVSLGVT